jgi:hypothetical protein
MLFAAQCADSDVLPPLVPEFKFCSTRKWRFDFCDFPTMLAFEIEGSIWGGRGRHVRGQGFSDDCEKYNEAAILGWRVLRFPSDWVYDLRAIRMAERAYVTLSRKAD